MPNPQAAYIEIVEKRRTPDTGSIGEQLIVPNEVRINGTPLLTPDGKSIKVHEVELSDSEVVMVTLTLFARRVEIKPEFTD